MNKRKVVCKFIGIITMLSVLVVSSCDSMPEWVDDLNSSGTFNNTPISIKTDEDGTVDIKSDNLDADFNVTIINEGVPVTDYVIDYTENGSIAIIHGYDPLNRYAPFVISGTPDYIETYFSDTQLGGRVLVTGTVILVIAIVAIYAAEYKFFQNALEVQNFYYENTVDYYDGGLVLETTFEELASDYIVPRISGVFNLVDISLTFISAGANTAVNSFGKATLHTVTCEGINALAQTKALGMAEDMVGMAVEDWGITAQQAYDSTIYVVVDIEPEDNGYEKMYASYKIYQTNPVVESFFSDSFENISTGEDPDSSLWTVTENGTADISIISGDASDGTKSAEFNDGVDDDACYMTANLGGMESGWIEWDWKVKNIGSFGFQAWSGSSSYSWDNVNFYLNFSSDQALHYNYSNDLLEESVFEYDSNKWYNMRIYFDCETDTIDLFVNDVKRLRQHSFWNSTDRVEYFRFIAFSDATIEGAVVDNINVIDDSDTNSRNSPKNPLSISESYSLYNTVSE